MMMRYHLSLEEVRSLDEDDFWILSTLDAEIRNRERSEAERAKAGVR